MRDVRLTESFSGFTLLICYALTNLCALRLLPAQRLLPIWLSLRRPTHLFVAGILGRCKNLAHPIGLDRFRISVAANYLTIDEDG